MVVQELLVDQTQELHAEVDAIGEVVQQAIQNGTPVHEVEEAVLRRALAIGRLSLEALFATLETGDVGATCALPNGRVLKRLKRLRPRPYRSVFGEFHLKRCVYAEREGRKIGFVPLDARLGLPEGKCSLPIVTAMRFLVERLCLAGWLTRLPLETPMTTSRWFASWTASPRSGEKSRSSRKDSTGWISLTCCT